MHESEFGRREVMEYAEKGRHFFRYEISIRGHMLLAAELKMRVREKGVDGMEYVEKGG
jgi:hypothetical protein